MHDVVVYSRKGCHLCDVVKETLRQAEGEAEFAWREVDIDADPELRAEVQRRGAGGLDRWAEGVQVPDGGAGVSAGAQGERVGRKSLRGEFVREGAPGMLGCGRGLTVRSRVNGKVGRVSPAIGLESGGDEAGVGLGDAGAGAWIEGEPPPRIAVEVGDEPSKATLNYSH